MFDWVVNAPPVSAELLFLFCCFACIVFDFEKKYINLTISEERNYKHHTTKFQTPTNSEFPV